MDKEMLIALYGKKSLCANCSQYIGHYTNSTKLMILSLIGHDTYCKKCTLKSMKDTYIEDKRDILVYSTDD